MLPPQAAWAVGASETINPTKAIGAIQSRHLAGFFITCFPSIRVAIRPFGVPPVAGIESDCVYEQEQRAILFRQKFSISAEIRET
jgi:hypothetical protein